MEYKERFKKVAVLGAAGKMGSGILLLTAMEMTDLSLGDKDAEMELFAVDISSKGLKGLMDYVDTQARKAAEKKTVLLRHLYRDRADLIENGEIIEAYVADVKRMINTSVHLEDVYGASLVFEAIKEDPELKNKILGKIHKEGGGNTWFFTNTSSIPINELNLGAGLEGNIIGFHFYNPPAVQKLVELIPAAETRKKLEEFAKGFAKSLRKVLVVSNDYAGFIGNGHFMRDALYGFKQAAELCEKMPMYKALYLVDLITRNWLVRPMGIIQLIDYVGVDVVSYIMKVMNPYLENENLDSPLLRKFIEGGILGGQNADGSQKNGILKYERGRPAGVYDFDKKDYVDISSFAEQADEILGDMPMSINWKDVNFSPDKADVLKDFFASVRNSDSLGCRLAVSYGLESKRIGEELVNSGVAASVEDVNKVLETGFYHAYGPVNEYFNS